jgi:hypothetical protein
MAGLETPVTGFGWSFYGFFVAAALWMAGYFAWSFRAAARDGQRGREGQRRREGVGR